MHIDPELVVELSLLRRFSMGGPVAMDVHAESMHQLTESIATQIESRFAEIRGAHSFVRRVRQQGWAVTIATGGWRASAEVVAAYEWQLLILSRVGLGAEAIPRWGAPAPDLLQGTL